MKCSQCNRVLNQFEKKWSIKNDYRICSLCATNITHGNREPIGNLEECSVTQKEEKNND